MNIIVADASAIIRAIYEQNLKNYPDIHLSASVSNGRKVIEAVEEKFPNILVTAMDMPEINGLETTKHIISKYHIPVIVVSDNPDDEIKARAAGACAFMHKPALSDYNESFFNQLVSYIKEFGSKTQRQSKISGSENAKNKYQILCIGASTGGPTAVAEVLKGLGSNFPIPIIYSQHIDIGNDIKMVQWFNTECSNVHVKLAQDGETAKPGVVYMAPADRHLVIDYVKHNSDPVLQISNDPPEHYLRPNVNVMFRSACKFYKKHCLAILLTGMGRDGATGCKKIVDSGGYTIVEHQSTCAVFGMPAAAIEEGGASEILRRPEIAKRILQLVGGQK